LERDHREHDHGLKEDDRADLVSHLSELRARLIRVLVYLVAGMAVVWFLFDPLYAFMVRPISEPLRNISGELTVRGVLEPLMVRLEIALVGGLVLAGPPILYEIWAFVSPGLTPSERRGVRPIVPVAGVLFLLGIAMGYLVTGPSVTVLLRYMPPDTSALLTLNDTILLLLKFYLAFGVGFQLPVVLVLLAKVGIVDSRMLLKRWREAVVAIFMAAAIITPTWDPITLTVCALPMVVLYVATIGVIKLIERRARKAAEREDSLAG
jgi:sec-independent protein translocase protein TatC